MNDINTMLITALKILSIAIFIFTVISFGISIVKELSKNTEISLPIIIWKKRWFIVLQLIIVFSMVTIFNLEQLYRPKSKLVNNTQKITMGYQEPKEIIKRKIIKLSKKDAFIKNRLQAEEAKKQFNALD